MEKLSIRQQQVFDFVKDYCDKHGYCPSLADIAQALSLHESTIATYTSVLKQKGFLTSDYRVARSLRVVEQEEEKPVTVWTLPQPVYKVKQLYLNNIH